MKKILACCFCFLFFFFGEQAVFAQEEDLTPEQQKEKLKENMEKLQTDTGSFDVGILSVGNEKNLTIIDPETGSPDNILNRIVKLFAQILGTLGILMLVIGGLIMITSEGDENRLQRGKNIFFYTIVGLLVGFASFIAVQFVISVIFLSA